jgi:high-affinity nickel-transport protein
VQFGWHGTFWDWVSGLDLNVMGFVIVGLFVLTWLGSMLIWRFGRIEEKWSVQPEC